jgi:hypothetical protein
LTPAAFGAARGAGLNQEEKMSSTAIHPRSAAADSMRESLDYAEWLQVESQARGKELSWDAGVIAGATAVTTREVDFVSSDLHTLVHIAAAFAEENSIDPSSFTCCTDEDAGEES